MYTARFFFLLALLPAAPFSAFGQITLDTTVALPNVTVTATRSRTTTARAPVHVSVLETEDISATGSDNVAELLEARSSLFLKRYGPTGIASLSMRGATASETLVLLDGFRIADPQLGELDMSLLPTILLESVEIVHGAGSALYGTDGLGGVINLQTVTPGTIPQARVRAGYGAWGARDAGIMLSGGQGRLSGLAAFDYGATEGDFPYLNEALFPPREVSRTGADRTQQSFYASARYAGEAHRLRVSGWYSAAERGLPGLAASRPQGERLWDGHLRVWGSDHMPFRWGSLRVGGLVQRATLRYANEQLGLDETGRTLLSSAEVEASVAASDHWLLAGGLAGGYNQAEHPSLADASDVHASAFVHATGEYGCLLIYPALRTDLYVPAIGPERVVPSPRLGLNVQPLPRIPLFLKAGIGRAFRIPTFNERFWQPGGDPDLRPEHGWTVDAGAFLQLRQGRIELSGFTGPTNDQIVWLPTEAGHYGAFNLSRVQRTGFELALHREWALMGSRMQGGLIYAFVDAEDRSDPSSGSYGKQLRYVPREQLKGYFGVRVGPVLLDFNGRYAGRRFVTSDESQFLDPYIVLDAQLRLEARVAGFRTQIALAFENLLNARYSVIQGYPMPPRHARLRLLIETPAR